MWKTSATRKKRGPLIRALLLAALLVAVAFGAYEYGKSQSPAGLSGSDQRSLRLYAEALDAVRDGYVDREAIDPKKQTYAAIEGMLDSLGDDGHTRFLTPEERRENQQGLSGNYVGIGVQLEDRDGRVVVASPIEGSPADRAGIESGDVLVAVNGRSVSGQELDRIADQVKGPEGTRVRITVLRAGEEKTFYLERAEIESPAVSWAMVPGTAIAHIRLASFSDDSARELRAAFEEARLDGAERFVLDLRDNPGGRLEQAVEMAGFFLEPESVVYIRRDASGEREPVRADGDAELSEVPLAVLVNGGSASSAEILAGALRDNGRARVIGQRTFGTGTVLSEFVLSDGSAILLGVAEWLTPDGDFIRNTGIEPDIRVELEEGEEPLSPSQTERLSREEISRRDPQLWRAVRELGGGV
ncbi:putative CtpA-like serine protease [Rubrobacter xylanophilus DSM 9941]|uniref:S41 family peptidase n=1 Tax=Rubrobacter xylanophilus TaxID=49319 RepID=UPI001C64007D|nr:S41 family peptidase [Rubrobacter xylanophilus]QYJ17079.1 putative CtpA-like serine protease [Rubrobacter xylanophilus DSM 9941]